MSNLNKERKAALIKRLRELPKDKLEEVMASLTPDERMIMTLRFGIGKVSMPPKVTPPTAEQKN